MPLPYAIILIVVVLMVIVGLLPQWRYNAGWGYWPSLVIGSILVVLLVLALMGKL